MNAQLIRPQLLRCENQAETTGQDHFTMVAGYRSEQHSSKELSTAFNLTCKVSPAVQLLFGSCSKSF
jgi:hypothetical protein